MAQDLELFTTDIYVAIENAIDIVVDKIIKVMQDEIDAQKIGIASNNEVYNPTGQFKQSWIPMVKQRLGLIIEGGMEYEPNMMTSIPNIFQHGSNIPTENDSREYLDDILFEGNSSNLWGGGWWTTPRDAWSEMEKYVDANIDRWFDDAMSSQGYSQGAKLL